MPKFKSQEEYDDWRSQQAIKRQGAKDLKKSDDEHPYYEAEKGHKGIGLRGLAVLIAVVVAGLLLWPAGRDFLAGMLKRLVP